MVDTTSARRRCSIALAALIAVLVFSTAASAERSLFYEETASAFWAVPHECADGSTVQCTLLVLSTRDFEAPETEDADPTVRVQFLAVCPDGTSFSWAAPAAPAVITSTENLKSVRAAGSGIARDNLGGTHQVSFDVSWTAVGPLKTTVNGPGSKRQQREATATGQVTFDSDVLVRRGQPPDPAGTVHPRRHREVTSRRSDLGIADREAGAVRLRLLGRGRAGKGLQPQVRGSARTGNRGALPPAAANDCPVDQQEDD
jgi:hypothetical protein